MKNAIELFYLLYALELLPEIVNAMDAGDCVSMWVYDNESRLFDFGEAGKNRAIDFYADVDYDMLTTLVEATVRVPVFLTD